MIKKFALALLALALISPAYAVPGVVTVDLEGAFVNITYDATGLEILSTQIVDEGDGFASLILEVDVTDSTGILEITIDRDFFDSKFEGVDDVFIIIADGDEPNSEEIATTTQSRTLRIELPSGTEEVEIIGTEFVMSETMPEPEPPAPQPIPCTLEYVPVCGIDGKTYGNMCMLDASGIALDYSGECVSEEPETPSGPKTQCGTGTVLKDGVCVLEEKCGPGTMLQDGVCVASPSAKKGDASISRDFITGGAFALGISLIAMIILGAIARASRT